MVGELAAGWWWDSLALIADAVHNLLDVLTLCVALLAQSLALRPPRGRRTYGHKRLTILVPLWTSLALLLGTGALIQEAFGRWDAPRDLPGLPIASVAGAGLAVNLLGAWLLHRQAGHDLNLRAAWVHLAADAAVSLAAVGAGLGIAVFGWWRLDALMAFAVALPIGWTALRLLRESFELAADVTPRGIEVEAVRRTLLEQDHIESVHDLHVWALSAREIALTAHVVGPERLDGEALQRLGGEMERRFGISHVTIQSERPAEAELCALSCGPDAR